MNGQNAADNGAGAVTLTQKKTVKLAKMAMLVAISLLLVNIHFPIFPPIAFMEYDPADIPILIGTFAFGPAAGILITVVTALLQGFTVSAASGLYGILMHIIATGTYVLVAGFIYKFHKGKKSAVIALIAGTLAMTAIMVPANLTITPYFMGVPVDAVTALLPFIIAFNLIKAGVNGLITFLVYKRVSKFLHR
ncbi:ECF transporter S component [Gallibacter intestinalis]|uniref:Riboflavin transporter n=1 Tax=Gallibacter intestinalis TaxID=2779356 RepID=A0ABR9QVB2_9FIRM|nr:ECF transporter S component [Gallibacter intestinalis]MBE5034807.1 ECF transporter S component [Gallibacter intestinalis]